MKGLESSMWCKYLFEMMSLLCSEVSSQHGCSLLNWINKGCQVEQMFFYGMKFSTNMKILQILHSNKTCSIYTGRSSFHAVACAAFFFFICFLFISFFFSCPRFCFWMLSWIFCLNNFFWLLIFSSSALLLASRSGSWNGSWITDQQQQHFK